MDIQIVNPITYPNWDEVLLRSPNYSFFHSSVWAETLNKSYHYVPLYFTIFRNQSLATLFPVMEVSSSLTGRRGISLPFTDYCEPIIEDDVSAQIVTELIENYGKKSGWKYCELRGTHAFCQNQIPSMIYIGHVLDLTSGPEKIFSQFRQSTRRNIRKAERVGLEIKISSSEDSLREFCQLNCLTRKYHGLPPQPYSFFRSLHKYIILKNFGFIVLAFFGGKAIAGGVYFHFGEKAIFKYGASDRNYHHLRPNNLVMWKAIKWYSENGYKNLCFGKTDLQNGGLRRFKRSWGTIEKNIHYYRYDIRSEGVLTRKFILNGKFYRIFNKMPGPLLKVIGILLYKHFG